MSDPPSIPIAPSSDSSRPNKPKRVRKPRGDKDKKEKSEDRKEEQASTSKNSNSNQNQNASASANQKSSKPNSSSASTAAEMEAKRVKEEKKKEKREAEIAKKKEKDEKKRKARLEKASIPKPRLKVIVRRLPPNLPEQIFWKSVEEWVRLDLNQERVEEKNKGDEKVENQDGNQVGGDAVQVVDATSSTPVPPASNRLPPTVDWKKFVKGKLSDNPTGTKPSVFSRAYIKFKDQSMLLQFSRSFDGHVFRDSKGNETVTVVEFAPYQRCPEDSSGGGGKKLKKDTRSGTIEEDSDYQTFLASISEKPSQDTTEKSDSQLMAHLTSTSSSAEQKEKSKSTPLLEFLRAQQLEKKALTIQSRGSASGRKGGIALTKKEALEMANKQIMSRLNNVTRDKGKKSYSGKVFGDEKGNGNRNGNEAESSNSGKKKSSGRSRDRDRKEKEKEKDRDRNKEKDKDKGKGKGKGKEKENEVEKSIESKPGNEKGNSINPSGSGHENNGTSSTKDQIPSIPKGPKKDKEKDQSNKPSKSKSQSQSQSKSKGPKGSQIEKPPTISQAPIAILKRDTHSSSSTPAPTSSSSGGGTTSNSNSASSSIPTGPKNQGQGGRSNGRGRGGGKK